MDKVRCMLYTIATTKCMQWCTQTLTVIIDTQLFIYKVAMGACLGLAALMLLTLGIVFICFLIHRQRRISQGTHLYTCTVYTLEIDRPITTCNIWCDHQSTSVSVVNHYHDCLRTMNGKTFNELKLHSLKCAYLSTVLIISKKTFRFQLRGGKLRERRREWCS